METAPYSHRYLCYVIALLFLCNVLNMMDQVALSILMPSLKREFGLSDMQLGLLSGAAFAIFYTLFGIPLARLADHGNRRSIIAVCCALWSVMTALTGATQNFLQLTIARVGVGIGEAGGTPPAHSMITDYFPPRLRGRVLAFHSAAVPLGSLLGLAVGGWLAGAIGWRLTFACFGLPGLLLSLLIAKTVREPVRDADRTIAAPAGSVIAAIRDLLGVRSFACLLIGVSGGGLAISGLVQWLPSYFLRAFDLSIGQVGLYDGLAFGLGSLTGILAGGPLGDLLVARDRRWHMWIASISYGLCCPMIVLALFATSPLVAFMLVYCAFALLSLFVGPVWAMIQRVALPRQRALAVAMTLLAGNLVGGGLGPLAIGMLSDLLNTGSAADSLRTALLCLMIFFPVPVIMYGFGARYLPGDIVRAEQTAEQR